jgi:uncharacterized protein YfbU (UPF0304 family)
MEDKMELSKKDRVFLINQYEILKRLDGENSYYTELIEILKHGYEIFYNEIDRGVSDDMPLEKCEFVLDLLNIYGYVEGYKASHPDDKDINDHLSSYFHGFDGNTEAEYLTFTRFLIHKQGKFPEQLKYKQKTDDFNSHVSVLDRYNKMIEKWKKMGKVHIITKENLLEILNASLK